MNIANQLTLARIFIVPIFVLLRYLPQENMIVISGALFIIAAITDFLDGYLARKYHLVTRFGKFADPLADKILSASAMVLLVGSGLIPAWTVVLIISREFAISGFRILAAGDGITIAAGSLGKVKTATQLVGLSWLLFVPMIDPGIGLIFYYISVLFTVISGVEYFWRNRQVFRTEE